MIRSATIDDLVRAARDLIDGSRPRAARTLLGMTGAPGAGKSTAARALRDRLGADVCAVVPMDGFHLPLAVIRGTPREERRGAPDTFDAAAFARAVRRVRDVRDRDVSLPSFDHVVGDPVDGGIVVRAGTPLVVVEGNYLLHEGPDWRRARAAMDAVWYLETDAGTRVERLEARHRELGRTPDDARQFVAESDERNAAVIAATAELADERFRLVPWAL